AWLDGLIPEPTKLKVSFAFLPRVVMAAMQTTMIRASITAYSTAVGPSSCLRNITNRLHRRSMGGSKQLRWDRSPHTEISTGPVWAGKLEAGPGGLCAFAGLGTAHLGRSSNKHNEKSDGFPDFS